MPSPSLDLDLDDSTGDTLAFACTTTSAPLEQCDAAAGSGDAASSLAATVTRTSFAATDLSKHSCAQQSAWDVAAAYYVFLCFTALCGLALLLFVAYILRAWLARQFAETIELIGVEQMIMHIACPLARAEYHKHVRRTTRLLWQKSVHYHGAPLLHRCCTVTAPLLHRCRRFTPTHASPPRGRPMSMSMSICHVHLPCPFAMSICYVHLLCPFAMSLSVSSLQRHLTPRARPTLDTGGGVACAGLR